MMGTADQKALRGHRWEVLDTPSGTVYVLGS